MGYRLGIDTGGTFTDVALMNEENGQIHVAKLPSTPENPSKAILDGITQILNQTGLTEKEVSYFIHGTTVATNALLEKSGANMALITTEGFRDVLQIERQTRPDLYDFQARKPEPLVPRNFRVEAVERIRHNGEIIKPLDLQALKKVISYLKEKEIKAFAVSLINSYSNPKHELLIKEAILKEIPDAFISLSCEVLPEYREYERTSTTVINSYVMPKMKKYLKTLKNALKDIDFTSDIYIMQSNGGVINIDTAMTVPARTVLSGPAGGALLGVILSEMTGRKNLITIDMGGTSLDTCLIENQDVSLSTTTELAGMPIKLPMIEMNTIGAGGGSIASVDTGGALKVGPKSAGAFPGPISYKRGGIEPTVTDANVVLGRINPSYILGGKMEIDAAAARKGIKEKIADPLNITVEEAAEGILKVVNANIVRGIHKVSLEKGYDPREFPLIAFGGGGPLNAADIASELGSPEVIIPQNPGIASAIGMLKADVKKDYVKALLTNIKDVKMDDLNRIFTGLETNAKNQLQIEGFQQKDISFIRIMDLRFIGQSYEISIPIKGDTLNQSDLENIIRNFHDEYEKLYGYYPDQLEEIELVNIRMISIGNISDINFSKDDKTDKKSELKSIAERNVFFDGEFMMTPIYKWDQISINQTIEGPAVIEQLDSTIVINPGQKATRDGFGNLMIKNPN